MKQLRWRPVAVVAAALVAAVVVVVSISTAPSTGAATSGAATGDAATTRPSAGDRPLPAARPATVDCTRFAATGGDDDSGSGSDSAPFRSVQRLVESLRAGETGCLMPGEYVEDVRIDAGGQPGAPLTLTSGGDRPASIVGRFVVTDNANDVVVSNLVLNGRNAERLPSPTVSGDRVHFEGNEVTNDHTAICFVLGSDSYGTAVGTVIRGNAVHDCGQLPPTNLQHGIYVAVARDTVIEGNEVYRNADRGIQMYPDAQNTRVVGNLLDRNGSGIIFSGGNTSVSNDNYVADNIISNSVRYNVESFWEQGVGRDNVVERNCLWPGGPGNIAPPVGFVERDNVVANPDYIDGADGDYERRATGRCAAMGPG